MGWKKRAQTKSIGKKVFLETMRNDETEELDYWIIPQKLSVDAMQKITQANTVDVELDEEDFKGKKIDEMEKLVLERVKKQKGKKSLFDTDTLGMIETAFLEGVKDHNFDDDEGKICTWDKELFDSLKKYPDTLLEIFRAVMRHNYPLAEEKSGN